MGRKLPKQGGCPVPSFHVRAAERESAISSHVQSCSLQAIVIPNSPPKIAFAFAWQRNLRNRMCSSCRHQPPHPPPPPPSPPKCILLNWIPTTTTTTTTTAPPTLWRNSISTKPNRDFISSEAIGTRGYSAS